jgi:hypothetical protein
MKNCKCQSCKCKKDGPDYFDSMLDEHAPEPYRPGMFQAAREAARFIFFFVLYLGVLVCCAFFLSSCCGPKHITYQEKEIPELSTLPVGVSLSFLDGYGKRTIITKLDSTNRAAIKSEVKPVRKGSFINVEINKDKSRVITDSQNKVTDKSKDKSRTETNSRNRQKEKTTSGIPWYAWLLGILLLAGYLFWKFG